MSPWNSHSNSYKRNLQPPSNSKSSLQPPLSHQYIRLNIFAVLHCSNIYIFSYINIIKNASRKAVYPTPLNISHKNGTAPVTLYNYHKHTNNCSITLFTQHWISLEDKSTSTNPRTTMATSKSIVGSLSLREVTGGGQPNAVAYGMTYE